MWTLRGLFAITLVIFCPAITWANGLLYRLPDDGTGVVYEMTVKSKKREMLVSGTLTMSSVGVKTIEGKRHRWIEFVMKLSHMKQDRTIVTKLLVPEDQLGKGKNPLTQCKKGWVRFLPKKAEALQKISGPEAGPIPAFLAGPLLDIKKLPMKEIETGIGKISCTGESGRIGYLQGKTDVRVQYQTRLTEKSPFGVASSVLEIQEQRDGKTYEEVTITLKLKSILKNARTALPQNH
ncbi:MAG: hypothetical protein Tsb009_14690 [Planctomycetaceae bacterium]